MLSIAGAISRTAEAMGGYRLAIPACYWRCIVVVDHAGAEREICYLKESFWPESCQKQVGGVVRTTQIRCAFGGDCVTQCFMTDQNELHEQVARSIISCHRNLHPLALITRTNASKATIV